MTNSNVQYSSRTCGFHRALGNACTACLKNSKLNPITYGPTAVELAGAMMGRPGRSENGLPKSWVAFATAHPDIATILRRSAAQLRVSPDPADKINPLETNETRASIKFLIVRNPDAASGALSMVPSSNVSTDTAIDGPGSLAASKTTSKIKASKSKAVSKTRATKKRKVEDLYDGNDEDDAEDDKGIDFDNTDIVPPAKAPKRRATKSCPVKCAIFTRSANNNTAISPAVLAQKKAAIAKKEDKEKEKKETDDGGFIDWLKLPGQSISTVDDDIEAGDEDGEERDASVQDHPSRGLCSS